MLPLSPPGLVHVSECGLEAGQKPGDSFQPGQGKQGQRCVFNGLWLLIAFESPMGEQLMFVHPPAPRPHLSVQAWPIQLSSHQPPPPLHAMFAVVKCRVLGADPGRKGLKLSLVSKSKKAAAGTEAAAAADGAAEAPAGEQQQEEKGDAAGSKAGKKKRGADGASDAAAVALGSYQLGDLVRGTVTAVHTKEVDGQSVPDYFELAVAPATAVGTPPGAASAPAIGRLELAHLADHPAAASALAATLTVGSQLGPLLVLQRMDVTKQLRLTRKACLLEGAAAGLLPASAADVVEGALLPGYVASVTDDAVFVR